jgi:hypothetical protein
MSYLVFYFEIYLTLQCIYFILKPDTVLIFCNSGFNFSCTSWLSSLIKYFMKLFFPSE